MSRTFLAIEAEAEPDELRELIELTMHRRHVPGRVELVAGSLGDLAVLVGREVKARRPTPAPRRPGFGPTQAGAPAPG